MIMERYNVWRENFNEAALCMGNSGGRNRKTDLGIFLTLEIFGWVIFVEGSIL